MPGFQFFCQNEESNEQWAASILVRGIWFVLRWKQNEEVCNKELLVCQALY